MLIRYQVDFVVLAHRDAECQRIIAGEISKKINKPVGVGRYVDISDSLHIYGSSLENAEVEIEKMKSTSFKDRAWETTHPAFEMMTEEAKQKLAENPDCYAKPNK